MNRIVFLPFCATFSTVAAIGLVIGTDPAVAQQAGQDQEQEMEEVIVEAPTVVRRRVRRGREYYELTELSRSVSYADLDLSRTADVNQLETRIEAAATEVCEELANMFPPLDEPQPRCIRDAIATAMEQVEGAIEVATVEAPTRAR